MKHEKYELTFKTATGDLKKVPAVVGENILQVAIRAGVDIDAPCSGNGTCGKCRVKLIFGTVDAEKSTHISKDDINDGWRLACKCNVSGDATLLVPDAAEAFRSGIHTAGLTSEAEIRRYDAAMSAIFASEIERGIKEQGIGLAIDIGTTTVTCVLLDFKTFKILSGASAGNGQIRYGADVINRIIQSSKPGGKERLQCAIREETIDPLIDELCRNASIDSNSITRAVIVGNTTMQHLLVGADAESIRLEPYVPTFLELIGETAGSLGLPIASGAPVVFAPNVGSYVGGDITAGVLASMMWADDEMTLLLDIGTNGELVFGNSDFMLCCACSAGPAFEGGDISCGMRATSGAIKAVTIDAETMNPVLDIIGGAAPAGLCGSGLLDTVSELFRCGIINARGKIERDGPRIRRGEYESSYVLALSSESATMRDIELTETDIDNFIRAKGAIFSAIRSMVSSLDMEMSDIDRILIAGGIGGGINIKNAISIGMLPNVPEDKYKYIGNSALTGACAMLQSDMAEQKVYETGRNMTYLELSSHPGYMDEFVAACFLPHTDADLFK